MKRIKRCDSGSFMLLAAIFASVSTIASAAGSLSDLRRSTAVAPPRSSPAPVTTTSYFPLVSTSSNVKVFFHLANLAPGESSATVSYTDQHGQTVATTTHTLGSFGRKTIDASSEVGTSYDGSAKVQTSGSAPVAVEKQVVFPNKTGNTTIGSREPGTNWGFVNGRTLDGSSSSSYTNYFVQNTSSAAADVTVNFYDANGALNPITRQVPAFSFLKLFGDDNPGLNKIFGAFLSSTQPSVAGFYQSFYARNAGFNYSEHVSPMNMNASRTFYSPGGNPLQDGTTSTYHILNNGTTAANVNFLFLPQNGGVGGQADKVVPAGTHKSFGKIDLGYSGSVVITSDKPVYAGQTNEWNGGHRISTGSLAQQEFMNWIFAHGRNGDDNKTFLQLQNSNNFALQIQVSFRPSFDNPVEATVQLPAQSSKTIDTQTYVPSGTFSTLVQSASPITVGRSMFWGDYQFGDSSLGYGYNNTTLNVTPATLNYFCRAGSTVLMTYQQFQVGFTPLSDTAWTASSNAPWLDCHATGSGPGDFSPSIDASGLRRGVYEGTITVSAPGAEGSPKTVTVRLEVF